MCVSGTVGPPVQLWREASSQPFSEVIPIFSLPFADFFQPKRRKVDSVLLKYQRTDEELALRRPF